MSKNYCRLCMGTPAVYYSILTNEFAKVLESLTSIKVTSDDDYSTVCCTKCMLDVKYAYSIQQNILKTDEKLRNTPKEIIVKLEELVEAENEGEEVEEETKIIVVKAEEEPMIVDDKIETTVTTEKLTCKTCMKVFEDQEKLDKHSDSHIRIKCHYCRKRISKNKIEQHIADHEKSENSDEEPELKCEICDKTFINKHLMKRHVHTECPICNMSLMKRNLPIHLKTHTDQEPEVCPICSAVLGNKKRLKDHMLIHKSSPQVCEICGATLANRHSLRSHLRNVHTTLKYPCDICDKIFNKQSSLNYHKKVHSGEKNHMCETCGKSFLSSSYLKEHREVAHLKLKQHICRFCNKQFSNRQAIKTHLRQHTNEKPYKCDICGEGFRVKLSMRFHKRSKHDIEEDQTCPCKICGRKFASEQAVLSHMRIH